jgi:magnesium-transporting ATPase (P-type)
LDTWETFFREKSARRSRTQAFNWRSSVTWALLSVVFLALVTAITLAVNSLI